jgi:hypothetical protein
MNDDSNGTTKQIKKLYKYKIKAYENPNKTEFSDYNIPLKFVLDNLKLTIDKDYIDYDLLNKLILQYCRTIKSKSFFSYKSVYEFLVELNIDKVYALKLHFTKILLCTQEIYENYIRIIQKYKDSIIKKLQSDSNIKETIIINKISKKYENQLENKDRDLLIKDELIKTLMTMLEIKNKKISKQLLINLEDKKTFIKDVNLPIFFSNDDKKNISSIKALAIMLSKELKITESKKLLNEVNNRFIDCRKLHFTEKEIIPHLYYDSDLENTKDESDID